MNPIPNLLACMASCDELLDGLTADQWATQSLCPAWTVRGVAAHLGAIEHMLLGEPPGSMTDRLPFGKAGDWLHAVAPLDDASFLTRMRATVGRRRLELAAMSDDQMALPSATPVGPGTYRSFMAVRVFDYWVHEQDIRVPLGIPGHESGPAAEMAIDQIHHSMAYIVGKKIGLPDGSSITVRLTGPVERVSHIAVDGRAGLVDGLASPDVTVVADSTAFALLACGRVDPQTMIEAGRIRWSGDDRLGERAARNLAFTI
jgi:uncharacterized protein (TIGR03083 family)